LIYSNGDIKEVKWFDDKKVEYDEMIFPNGAYKGRRLEYINYGFG
jgi:hypothetical protein